MSTNIISPESLKTVGLGDVNNQNDLLQFYNELQQYKLDGSNYRFFQKASVGAMATLGKTLQQVNK